MPDLRAIPASPNTGMDNGTPASSSATFSFDSPTTGGASGMMPASATISQAIALPLQQAPEITSLASNLAGYVQAIADGKNSGGGSGSTICLKTALPAGLAGGNGSEDAEADCAVPLQFAGF